MKQFIIWLAVVGTCLVFSTAAASADVRSVHHDLQVDLDPSRHRLTGIDRIEIETNGKASGPLDFFLSSSAANIEVLQNGKPVRFMLNDNRLRVNPVSTGSSAKRLQITVTYTAVFDDSAPALPVTP